MRFFPWAAMAVVLVTTSSGTAQEPVGMIVRNPYYHAEISAPATPQVAPAPYVAPVPQFASPAKAAPQRVVSTGEMMRALHDAVRTSPTATETPRSSTTHAPARFVPSADVAPIAGFQSTGRYDRAVIATTAHMVDAKPASRTLAATRSLREAVAANMEVTLLSSNPLRESTPNPSTLRVVNPLR